MNDHSGLRVPATYITSLLREFGSLLQDQGKSTDLSAFEASSAAGKAQLDAVFDLIGALNERIGPEWPVRASFTWRNQMHGTIDVASRSADTLGGALDVLGKYGSVRAPFANIEERRSPSERVFTYSPATPMEGTHWQSLAEFMLLGSMAILHQSTDNQLEGARIKMPTRSFAHRCLLEDSLLVPVDFGGDEFAMHFAENACEKVLPFRDEVLFNAAVQQLQAEASQLAHHDWIVEDVRRILTRQTGTRPTAKSVAQEIGLSQRTLVRKLASHDTSFRELLDKHLMQRATQLMEQGDLTYEDIAEELGYGDRTSFSRARRRWSMQRH